MDLGNGLTTNDVLAQIKEIDCRMLIDKNEDNEIAKIFGKTTSSYPSLISPLPSTPTFSQRTEYVKQSIYQNTCTPPTIRGGFSVISDENEIPNDQNYSFIQDIFTNVNKEKHITNAPLQNNSTSEKGDKCTNCGQNVEENVEENVFISHTCSSKNQMKKDDDIPIVLSQNYKILSDFLEEITSPNDVNEHSITENELFLNSRSNAEINNKVNKKLSDCLNCGQIFEKNDMHTHNCNILRSDKNIRKTPLLRNNSTDEIQIDQSGNNVEEIFSNINEETNNGNEYPLKSSKNAKTTSKIKRQSSEFIDFEQTFEQSGRNTHNCKILRVDENIRRTLEVQTTQSDNIVEEIFDNINKGENNENEYPLNSGDNAEIIPQTTQESPEFIDFKQNFEQSGINIHNSNINEETNNGNEYPLNNSDNSEIIPQNTQQSPEFIDFKQNFEQIDHNNHSHRKLIPEQDIQILDLDCEIIEITSPNDVNEHSITENELFLNSRSNAEINNKVNKKLSDCLNCGQIFEKNDMHTHNCNILRSDENIRKTPLLRNNSTDEIQIDQSGNNVEEILSNINEETNNENEYPLNNSDNSEIIPQNTQESSEFIDFKQNFEQSGINIHNSNINEETNNGNEYPLNNSDNSEIIPQNTQESPEFIDFDQTFEQSGINIHNFNINEETNNGNEYPLNNSDNSEIIPQNTQESPEVIDFKQNFEQSGINIHNSNINEETNNGNEYPLNNSDNSETIPQNTQESPEFIDFDQTFEQSGINIHNSNINEETNNENEYPLNNSDNSEIIPQNTQESPEFIDFKQNFEQSGINIHNSNINEETNNGNEYPLNNSDNSEIIPQNTQESPEFIDFDQTFEQSGINIHNCKILRVDENIQRTALLSKNDANTEVLTDQSDNIVEEVFINNNQTTVSPDETFVRNNSKIVLIQCMNCDQIFDENEFKNHICQYNKCKRLITEEEIHKCETEGIEEPLCIQQTKDNLEMLRKFLIDECKIDSVGLALNNNHNSTSSCSNDNNTNGNKKLNGPYECTMCERKFVHASGLSRHMEKHAMDLIPTTVTLDNGNDLQIVVECLLCGKISFSILDHHKHMSDIHGQWFVEIDNDDTKTVLLDTINRGMEIIDGFAQEIGLMEPSYKYEHKVVVINSVLQCEYCDNFFSNATDLLIHTSTHDPIYRFHCQLCDVTLFTYKEIFVHWQSDCLFKRKELMKNWNVQKVFVCNVCENKFASYEQLYEHRYATYHFFPRIKSNLDQMQVFCEYCGDIYTNAKLLMKHHNEKHVKKFVKRDHTVATSSSSTTRSRLYLCDVCGKSYTQSSHLWQHLRFHKGVKPFACEQPGCNRRFTIRPDLNDHIRKCHTGERPYHCLVCGKRFLTGSVFYQHRLIHRGERRYGCTECGKRFYRADALKNHQRIHTGEKPYSCLYCAKCFRQRGDRDKHIRARHGNSEANAKALQSMTKTNQQKHAANINEVVYVGNIPFPASMFKPIVTDIDKN